MMRPEEVVPTPQAPSSDPASATNGGPLGPSGVAPPSSGRSRLGTTLVGSTVGMVVALAIVVFALQNETRQSYEFLWFDFTLPGGIAIVLATICGGLVVALLGLGRVLQLRLAARRHRRADHQPD